MLPVGRMRIDSDEMEVLRSFVACGVRFLIIGGRAVQFHGHFRPAKDLDLLVEFSEINWEKLGGALRPLNASVPPFNTLSREKRYQAKHGRMRSKRLWTASESGFSRRRT